MLPKKKRVTKELFQKIIKNGRIISSLLFTFKYLPRKSPQYAFVVPKIITKSAVKRNKYRRIGYNTLNLQDRIPNYAGVFLYKKEAIKAEQNTIINDINTILSKIN